MSCKICGGGSCASYFHSSRDQALYNQAEEISENPRKVVELLKEIESLKSEIEEKDKIIERLENHE